MKRYLSIISLVFLLFSCRKVEKIENIGNIQPRLCLNCVLMKGSVPQIYLNKSLSALDNAPMKSVPNALVLIYKNGLLLDTAKYISSSTCYGSSKFIPETGVAYTIKASAKGYDPVEANAYLPNDVVTSGVSIEIKQKELDSSNFGAGWKYYGRFKSGTIKCSFMDESGVKNRYMITIDEGWKNSHSNDYYFNSWVCDNEGVETIDNFDYSYGTGGKSYFLNDDLYDGKKIDLEFNTESEYNTFMSPGDTLEYYSIRIYSFTEDFSKHVYTVKINDQNQNNPFSEPVQIFSNVKGGYGAFGGQSIREMLVAFPK
ncbi:MAG: DUF4249 domain-containing protein [Bacteroidetes bacterium]|nr:DUF4249 domain-containing protein [Bacteroidota bacterium]